MATPRKACNVRYFYVRNRHPALRHSRFASAHCQRPAPAGRVTRARGSLTISERKTRISDFETEKCHIWLAMYPRFRLRGEDGNSQKNKAARCSRVARGLTEVCTICTHLLLITISAEPHEQRAVHCISAENYPPKYKHSIPRRTRKRSRALARRWDSWRTKAPKAKLTSTLPRRTIETMAMRASGWLRA